MGCIADQISDGKCKVINDPLAGQPTKVRTALNVMFDTFNASFKRVVKFSLSKKLNFICLCESSRQWVAVGINFFTIPT